MSFLGTEKSNFLFIIFTKSSSNIFWFIEGTNFYPIYYFFESCDVNHVIGEWIRQKRDDLVARVKSFLESASYNESVSWLPGLLSHSTAVLCLKENSSACLSTIEIDQLRKSRTNPLTNQSEVSSEQIEIEKKSLAQLFINWSFFERHYENKVGLFSQLNHSKFSFRRFLSICRKFRLIQVFRANEINQKSFRQFIW